MVEKGDLVSGIRDHVVASELGSEGRGTHVSIYAVDVDILAIEALTP